MHDNETDDNRPTGPRTPYGELYERFGGDRYTEADALARFQMLDAAHAAPAHAEHATPAKDTGWRTIRGVHVHINDKGVIDRGPAALKGKTHAEVHEHVKKNERAGKPAHDPDDVHVKAEKAHADRKAGKHPIHIGMSESKQNGTLGSDHPLRTGHSVPELEDTKPAKARQAKAPTPPAEGSTQALQHAIRQRGVELSPAQMREVNRAYKVISEHMPAEQRKEALARLVDKFAPERKEAAAASHQEQPADAKTDHSALASHVWKTGNEADLADWSRAGAGTHTRQHVPAAIGQHFQGHGVGTAKGLIDLLANGIDKGRTFYTEQLSGVPQGTALLRDHQPFMVVGAHGDRTLAGGIKSVIVDGHHAAAIPALQKAFPDVKFIRHDQAAGELAKQTVAAGKTATPSAPADTTPYGIAGEKPSKVVNEDTARQQQAQAIAKREEQRQRQRMLGPAADAAKPKHLVQYMGQETREQSLNRYKLARGLGLNVAKPMHGSEQGYLGDADQKQFEHYLDTEYERQHGLIDENDHKALAAAGYTPDYHHSLVDAIGPLLHRSAVLQGEAPKASPATPAAEAPADEPHEPEHEPAAADEPEHQVEPAVEHKPVRIKKPKSKKAGTVEEGAGVAHASIERQLHDFHDAHGGDEVDGRIGHDEHDEHGEYGQVASVANRTFRGEKLPGEVRDFLQGRPHLRPHFKLAKAGQHSGGEDAMSAMGADKYFDAVEQMVAGRTNRAVMTAKQSGDPGMRFLAAVHERWPELKTSIAQRQANKQKRMRGESVTRQANAADLIHYPTSKLKPGHSFTIHGEHFHVDEQFDSDEQETGRRVILGPSHYPELPIDALDHLPIDRDSLMRRREVKPMQHAHTNAAADADVPFSYTESDANDRLIELSQMALFGGPFSSHDGPAKGASGSQGHLFAGHGRAAAKSEAKKEAKKADEGHWVTIHGSHILIKRGQSIGKAIHEHFAGHSVAAKEAAKHEAVKQVREQGGRVVHKDYEPHVAHGHEPIDDEEHEHARKTYGAIHHAPMDAPAGHEAAAAREAVAKVPPGLRPALREFHAKEAKINDAIPAAARSRQSYANQHIVDAIDANPDYTGTKSAHHGETRNPFDSDEAEHKPAPQRASAAPSYHDDKSDKRVPTMGESATVGKSFQRHREEVAAAYHSGRISADHPAYQELQAPNAIHAYTQAQDMLGQHVKTPDGEYGVVKTLSGDLHNANVHHDDGSISTHPTDHLQQFHKSLESGDQAKAIAYMAPKLAEQAILNNEPIDKPLQRAGIPAKMREMRAAVAGHHAAMKPEAGGQVKPRTDAEPATTHIDHMREAGIRTTASDEEVAARIQARRDATSDRAEANQAKPTATKVDPEAVRQRIEQTREALHDKADAAAGKTSRQVMGVDASLEASHHADGVDYELHKPTDPSDKRGIVRVFDRDSGQLVTIKAHPQFDNAKAEYEKAVGIAGSSATFAKPAPDLAKQNQIIAAHKISRGKGDRLIAEHLIGGKDNAAKFEANIAAGDSHEAAVAKAMGWNDHPSVKAAAPAADPTPEQLAKSIVDKHGGDIGKARQALVDEFESLPAGSVARKNRAAAVHHIDDHMGGVDAMHEAAQQKQDADNELVWSKTRQEYLNGIKPLQEAKEKLHHHQTWSGVSHPETQKANKELVDTGVMFGGIHERAVKDAIAAGKDVPTRVLVDYPGLTATPAAEPMKAVDPSRQFGLFAKDAAGNAQEVGEKPGQAGLFSNLGGNSQAKPAYTPVDADAALRAKFDEKATGNMFGDKPATPQAEPVTVYHGSHEQHTEFGTGRTTKNFDSSGTWFTSDPERAKDYGPNIHKSQIDVSKFKQLPDSDFLKHLGGHADVAEAAGHHAEAKVLREATPDTNAAREHEKLIASGKGYTLSDADIVKAKKVAAANKAASAMLRSPQYAEKFREKLQAQGHEGIAWKGSTIDNRSTDKPHDVYMAFNSQPIATQMIAKDQPERPAADAALRAKFDEKATGQMFGDKPADPEAERKERTRQLDARIEGKQPWEVSKKDYVDHAGSRVSSMTEPKTRKLAETMHAAAVREAYGSGKSVPEHVMSDYPNLKGIQRLTPNQTPITKQQALALHGNRPNLLPKPGETKPQPGDTTGQYHVGHTPDGRFYTEKREATPAATPAEAKPYGHTEANAVGPLNEHGWPTYAKSGNVHDIKALQSLKTGDVVGVHSPDGERVMDLRVTRDDSFGRFVRAEPTNVERYPKDRKFSDWMLQRFTDGGAGGSIQGSDIIAGHVRRKPDAGTAEAKPADTAPTSSTPATPASDTMFGDAPANETKQQKAERVGREAAMKATDPNYAFARASAYGNAGEDLLGSARHKVNARKSLEQAEADGSAAEYVTRESLLKNDPHTLADTIKPHNSLAALAGHMALQAFPADPTKLRGKAHHTPELRRRQYHEAYQHLKGVVEKAVAEEHDPVKVLERVQTATHERIRELRGQKPGQSALTAEDAYNPIANSLVDTMRRVHPRDTGRSTSVISRVREFAGKLGKKYGEPSPAMLEKSVDHVKDVMNGHSFNKTFDTVEKDDGTKFNPAEAYVAHATRTGGRQVHTGDPHQASEFVTKSVGMRGLQWGNSVSDQERRHHLGHAANAMADLADVTGLPEKALSLDGKLGFAIGARGHGAAAAHYEPGSKVINITRKGGVGTVAHEWAHALDHHIAGGGLTWEGEKRVGDYMSERTSPKSHRRDEKGNYVNEITSKPGSKYQTQRAVYDDNTQDPVWSAMHNVRQSMETSGFNQRLKGVVANMVKEGRLKKGDGGIGSAGYWQSNLEKFARTFETHVQHKLKGEGRENTYLSGLASGDGLWPTPEESAHMAPHVDHLMRAIHAKHFGGPAVTSAPPAPTKAEPAAAAPTVAGGHLLNQLAAPTTPATQQAHSDAISHQLASNAKEIDEHQTMVMKKDVSDRFKKAHAEGQLTDEQHAALVANGGILSEADEAKAAEAKRKIEEIRSRPLGTPAAPAPRDIDFRMKGLSDELRDAVSKGQITQERFDKHKAAGNVLTDAEEQQYAAKRAAREAERKAATTPAAETPTEKARRVGQAAADAAIGKTPEPQPAAETPAAGPYTLAEHDAFNEQLEAGKVTPAELQANYARVKEHGQAIKDELRKQTVDNLNRKSGQFHKLTKEKAVDAVYSRMLEDHHVGESFSYNPFGKGGHQAALDEYVAGTTPEHIAAYATRRQAAKQARAERVEQIKGAVENPKTLEDYQTLIRVKGRSTMTSQQKAHYDALHAEHSRGERQREAEQRATVGQVHGHEGLDMDIKQTTHTKTGKPLHVAVLNQRVERDKYTELNQKAKQLGGYYSSFRGGGAIPGFQFDTPEAAQQFKSLLGGSVDRTEALKANQAESRQTAAQRLRETATRLHESAHETLNADRKVNTARRANMASNIEKRAQADLAHAKTMHNVADAVERGEAPALAGVRHASHLQQLNTELSRAKWNRIQADEKANPGRPYSERENEYHRAANHDDVEHAQYPYPSLRASELNKHAKALADVPGFKLVGQKLGKAAKVAAPEFRGQGNGFKFNGGAIYSPESLKQMNVHVLDGGDKHVRIHSSSDWRLRDQARKQGISGPIHTADGGKTWGVDHKSAVAAAVNKGNKLDLVDAPKDELVHIIDPDAIEQIGSAAIRLKSHANRDLQHIGERLHGQVEDYKRLRAANIHTPQELRTAMRQYLSLKGEQEKADPVKSKERALIGQKIPGFFPTPRPTVDRMLDAADIQPGHSVLEPSAGKGDILDAVHEREPEATTTAIEPHSSLRDIISAKGHALHDDRDFLQHQGQYDRIVMNPPFENGQDIDHVQHAYKQLKPGGKMVAIMSEGPFFRQDKKASGFRDWLGDVAGDHEQLPAGSFMGNDAFRQTGVNTRMVTIHKPHDDDKTNLSAAWQAEACAMAAAMHAGEPAVMLSASDDNEDVLYLSAACDARDAVTLGQGLPPKHNDLPIRYKWHDAAIAGNWTHPKTGAPVHITRQRIDNWVKNIHLSCSRGVELPACKDHKETADNSLGAIYGARRDGDRLSLLIGYYGDDAYQIGQRNKLSIGIDRKFRDAYGHDYGEAIRHVAITPKPVIHGQRGFLN